MPVILKKPQGLLLKQPKLTGVADVMFYDKEDLKERFKIWRHEIYTDSRKITVFLMVIKEELYEEKK